MKISVITATRNRKAYLQQAIASVRQSILIPLTNVYFEHIVYDDASTDGTEHLFKGTEFSTIRYFRGTKRVGQSAARNEAIKHAQGQYLFILDDDDVTLQRTLYNFASTALRNPATRWFVCDFLRVDEELRYELERDYYGWEFDDPNEMLTSIFRGEHFIQNNTFYTKSLFDAVGGFDAKLDLAEDLDLYIRFLRADAHPIHSPFISHLHRSHNANISAGVSRKRHFESLAALKKKYGIA